MRGLSQTGPVNEESSTVDKVSRADLVVRSVNPVVDTESKKNVRLGSLADLCTNISSMSAFGWKAEVQAPRKPPKLWATFDQERTISH